MKTAIIGAGVFGTALGGILADNGFDIDYYDVNLAKERLVDVLDGAECILLCIPSGTAPYLLPHLPKNIPLIVASKGFLTDTVFDDFADWMIISGPGYASDIKAGKSTHLTTTDLRVIKMFKAEFLDFDQTTDKKGVLMCGALKNVYAIEAGRRELQPGTKAHEQYLSEVVDEMQALLLANDAKPQTVQLNCGKGDLKVTCGPSSRNYRFGQHLKGNSRIQPEETVEGLTTLRRIKRGEIIIPGNLKILEEILYEIEC